MARYFFDTEFIEGWKKPIKWLPTVGRFNKPYHSIQLISIGIVAEDGREYYAISNEYKWSDASKWVQDNVIIPMYRQEAPWFKQQFMDEKTFHKYTNRSRSNKQIAEEIKHFCNPELFLHNTAEPDLQFYAYYGDYDWVLFCSLFGTMMELPKSFPMYCIDLKQEMDRLANVAVSLTQDCSTPLTHEKSLGLIKNGKLYPKQENEHNALDDARWNFDLYKYLR
jgi:hypothetical protein